MARREATRLEHYMRPLLLHLVWAMPLRSAPLIVRAKGTDATMSQMLVDRR